MTTEPETGEPRVWLHMVDADCWCCYHLVGEDDPRFLTEYVPATRVAELERERDALREALMNLADKAHRASLVQDRSVGLIKQACAYIAKEARAALGETT